MARYDHPPGTPLPDDHPFKNGCVIFGMKRPGSSAKPSMPTTVDPGTKSSPEDNSFDIAAHKSLEESLHRLYEQHTGQPWTEPSPPLEFTTPESPENPSPGTSTEQE